MKVYEAIIKIQDTLQVLENSVDKQYWPDALKKATTLINNAEYNEAQVVARQALHRAKEASL
jgi:Fe-S cluster biosynthesis and repair protein YggX